MSETSVAPEPGQIVRVRLRQYLVEAVTPPPPGDEQTLVELSCLDDDAQGAPLSVLWESEVDAGVLRASSWRSVVTKGFDDPRRFSAYLHVQRWNCVTSTDPRLFQAPYRAGIEAQAYQLEPLRKALLLPRVNLFIADEVGVGKTIEAGLILRELLMRQKVRKVVVACPPSVVLQWRDELDTRFGLSFAVFDRAFVTDRRRERGYAVNPFSTHNLFILSHALLRDEAYAAPLRDWLEDERAGSLLILDEAHNAAPAQSSKYAVDSKLTRAVRGLAERFEHRIFLSATPHNGHSNSFAALLEILDPQRFCRGVKIESTRELEPVMVRRLKEDLRRRVGAFPERKRPSTAGSPTTGSARRSSAPSTRTRGSTRCASSSPRTPPARAATCRTTAPTSSTSTSPGTRAAWSSATAASTGSSSALRRCAATTSSSPSARRTGCWRCWSRRRSASAASWAAWAPWWSGASPTCSRRASPSARSRRSPDPSTTRAPPRSRSRSSSKSWRRRASATRSSPPRSRCSARCWAPPRLTSSSTRRRSARPSPVRWSCSQAARPCGPSPTRRTPAALRWRGPSPSSPSAAAPIRPGSTPSTPCAPRAVATRISASGAARAPSGPSSSRTSGPSTRRSSTSTSSTASPRGCSGACSARASSTTTSPAPAWCSPTTPSPPSCSSAASPSTASRPRGSTTRSSPSPRPGSTP